MTANPSPDTPEKSVIASRQQHDRAVFRQVVLPLVGAFVLMVAVISAAFLVPLALGRPVEVQTVSGIMLILFILLPQILCFLVFYLLLVSVVFGLDVFTNSSARQLRKLHRLSRGITDTTIRLTENVNQRTANLRVSIAGLEHTMEKAFKVEDESTDERTTTDNNPTPPSA